MNDLFTKFDFEIEISGNQTQQKNWIFLSDPIRSVKVETRHKAGISLKRTVFFGTNSVRFNEIPLYYMQTLNNVKSRKKPLE